MVEPAQGRQANVEERRRRLLRIPVPPEGTNDDQVDLMLEFEEQSEDDEP